MATITSLDSATGLTGSTTLTVAGGITVAVDDMVLVILAHPNSGSSGAAPTTTVADSDGINTYTKRDTLTHDPGAAGDGTVLELWTCLVTDAVTAGDIDITYGDSTATRTAQVYRIRPASGERITFNSVGAGTTGSTASYSPGAVSVTNGDVIFGAASVETDAVGTGDSDTTNGSWSTLVQRTADNGGDAQSTINLSQYKVVTATGNQTWTATTSGAHGSAVNYIIFNIDKFVAANAGSYTMTGTAASLERGFVVTAGAGSYVMTGEDASLSATGAKVVNPDTGAYDQTGTDASTLHAWIVTAAAGQYDITGTDTPVLHQWKVFPDAGSYAMTGTDTPVLQQWKVDATTAGSYAMTGSDVALQKSGAFSIAAEAGSYTMTGADVTTVHGFKFTADAGSYDMTGTNATLVREWFLFADPGEYLLTGTDVDFVATEASPAPIIGTLVGAPFSHSLIIKRPPASLAVTDNTYRLRVNTTTPTLQGASHTHTLRVRF